MRAIEDSKAIFLTSDVHLSRYNFEMEHKDNGTISEVISDRLLTNIIWLKNPCTKPSLKPIIAAHSRDLFVKRHVWDKFYEVLIDLKKSGKVKEDDLTTLFWHNYIEDALRSVEDLKVITSDFILEAVEKAGEKRQSDFQTLKEQIEALQIDGIEKEEEIKQKETELQKSKEELQNEKDSAKSLIESLPEKIKCDRDREWLAKIQDSKEAIRQSSEKTTILVVNGIRISLITLYCASVLISYFMFNVPWQLTTTFFAFIGTGGLIGLWKLGGKSKSRLFNYVYKKRLKASGIENIKT